MIPGVMLSQHHYMAYLRITPLLLLKFSAIHVQQQQLV